MPVASADGLIDDEGNLLGVVNVVDALVVLLVVAVAIAGVALVLGGGDDTTSQAPETGTTFVTLDLGTHPDYLASTVAAGDTWAPTGESNLTVTDVYRGPAGDQARVVLRAELTGIETEDGIAYAGTQLRLGRSIGISTARYNATGQITEVGDGRTLDTNTTTVVLRDSMAPATASDVTAGDEVTVAGHGVATVGDVAVYPTTDPTNRTVLVEADLETYTREGSRRFGDTVLRPGRQVALSTAAYTIDGTVERLGGGLERDSLRNRTVTLQLTEVSRDTAAAVRPGQTERLDGRTTVYLTDVNTEPTPIVATAQNGSVVVSDHPTLRDVTLTTDLQVSETTDGIRFRGERLQYGSTVVLDLGTVTVEATVTDIGA